MADATRPIYIVVTPFFPSHGNWRGAYILDQVKAIKRNSDFEVVVFKTHTLKERESDYEIDGIKVHCITPLLMPSYIFNGATEGLVGHFFVRKLRRLRIDPMQVKFIHCHTLNHAAFGFGVRSINPDAKVILQFHDLDPLTLRNGTAPTWAPNLRYKIRKSILAVNRADLIVCISEAVRDVLLSFPQPRKEEVYEPALEIYKHIPTEATGVHPHDIYILNNGVDTAIFKSGKRSPEDVFRIGCIANFVDLKDHRTLLESFNLLIKSGYTNMRLSLLGSGPKRQAIEYFIHQEGLENYVEFPSEVPHEQLPDYYQSLDLFVLPSRFEGFGCVLTEAWACGIPFICCRNQGAAECIPSEEQNLWLVDDRSPQQLAALIERQYLNPLSQNLCKEVDIDLIIKKFLNYLSKII